MDIGNKGYAGFDPTVGNATRFIMADMSGFLQQSSSSKKMGGETPWALKDPKVMNSTCKRIGVGLIISLGGPLAVLGLGILKVANVVYQSGQFIGRGVGRLFDVGSKAAWEKQKTHTANSFKSLGWSIPQIFGTLIAGFTYMAKPEIGADMLTNMFNKDFKWMTA